MLVFQNIGSRIADVPDAMVTPQFGDVTTQQDQKIMPHASVDLTGPNVTIQGLPGTYRVWCIAARSDDRISNWEHITTTPEQEEEEV